MGNVELWSAQPMDDQAWTQSWQEIEECVTQESNHQMHEIDGQTVGRSPNPDSNEVMTVKVAGCYCHTKAAKQVAWLFNLPKNEDGSYQNSSQGCMVAKLKE